MRYCLNCGKCVNETANFCNNCGIPLKKINNNSNNVIINNNTHLNSTKKEYNVLSIVFTVIYIVVYTVNWWFWGGISKLGNGFAGKELILTIEDCISVSIVSMLFSFIPCILATVFSSKSDKSNLFVFNMIFLIVNVLLFLLSSFLGI